MKGKVVIGLLAIPLILYLLHFFFFWIFESTDSYFYWAFANFLKTGQYSAPHPYHYQEPSTMEPPLYSLFLYLVQFSSRADILIHFFQISSIVVSAFLIYKMMKGYFDREKATIAAVGLLLVPGNFIYVSNLVAEPIAILFITTYLFLCFLIIKKEKTGLVKYLLVLAAFATLQRYNLLPYFLVASLIFFLKKEKKLKDYLCFVLGLSILGGWILLNHRLNGSWGLNNSAGKHLYNRVLHFDRLLPEETHPSFVKFREIVGEGIDYFKQWWFYEEPLMAKLGNETKASQLMGKVALAAFFHNPLKYFLDTPAFFLFAHGQNPTYHDPLYRWQAMKNDCRKFGTIQLCQPVVKTKISYKIWDAMVGLIDFYYLNFAQYLNYFLLFPALIYSFFRKTNS